MTANLPCVSSSRRLASDVLRLVLASMLTLTAMAASADSRDDFLAAEQALKDGDRARFESLVETLREYPLYPYLRFADLTGNLNAAPDSAIEAFLDADPDSPLADRLRLAYLRRLADAGRWTDYARVYRADESVERRCLYLRALIESGRAEEAMPQVESVWLSARSRPDACDSVFAAWRQAGHLTPGLTWRRIRLAMESGETGLARGLGTLLPEAERPWLERWLDVDRDPARMLETVGFSREHPLRAAILAHGIVRLARRAPDDAALALMQWREALAVDPAALDRAHAAVGRALARTGERLGLAYWDGLRETGENLPEQEARLRAAIELIAWDWVAKWIARMPDSEEKRDRWLYWQGRAEERLGHAAAAQASFEQAARQRGFWGFMAADRIGQPYRLDHAPTPAEPARIRRLVLTPAFQRIRELHPLGRETDIRREWRALTRNLEAPDLLAAAVIADALRWHDQAIFTLARTGYWDDLHLRFPVTYRELVTEQAWQTGIDAAWIFAVMRQESVFARTIASNAGAIGLMQLMPATAAEVAADLDLDAPSRWSLLDPALNIALGSSYLARMRDRFGHAALATAAYNAGPSRVARWLPEDCLDADLWIARIPFAETRAYVERVLTYRVIYADRLGLAPVRLSELLPPVPAAGFWREARLEP
ncbi:soluble lytic murein transglycosylase-like protein [Thiocystis violascens DSM 198]|uniref:Soluble lytic murein transglycosylase-like protein n=2 Tax=Thiocystis violascens TaxID=73141 RepID=I3YH78_THIV6|nr:soluble lytic murein transglycosylase-like protein [Thiocystis violascens DSM 198]